MGDYILESDKITETIGRLRGRIRDRFPESGLHLICRKLEDVSQKSEEIAVQLDKPIWWYRILLIVLLISLATILIIITNFVKTGIADIVEDGSIKSYLEMFESASNDLILIGLAFLFLFTLEIRLKRQRALAALHRLRSIAHIIDMHQLTKDPERVISSVYVPTELSPKTHMNIFQLRRYLEYCSELLSLTGKVAAVHVQKFDDSVAASAVNEIESLTTGLSRKIWQKIIILHTVDRPSSIDG